MLFFSALFGRIWNRSSSSWLSGSSLPECEPPPPFRPAAVVIDVVAASMAECRQSSIYWSFMQRLLSTRAPPSGRRPRCAP